MAHIHLSAVVILNHLTLPSLQQYCGNTAHTVPVESREQNEPKSQLVHNLKNTTVASKKYNTPHFYQGNQSHFKSLYNYRSILIRV